MKEIATATGERDDTCIVCGKDTSGGRGFMNLNHDGRLLPLCCPMCYKVFQEDPARYASKRRAREIDRVLGVNDPW